MIDVEIKVDSGTTDALLVDLMSRTSPSGVRHFLDGPLHSFLTDRIALRFGGEGDDASGKWAELSMITGFHRRRQGFPPFHPINIRTGAMFGHLMRSKSVTGETLNIPGSSTGLMRKKIRTAQMGDPGTDRRSATPPRPVLAMNSVDAHYSVSLLELWITQGGI